MDTGEATEDTYDEIWDIEDSAIKRRQKTRLGREPPDAMSLCYADIEPPRFTSQTEPPLCRQSLRYAVNEPPHTAQLFLNLGFYE